MTTSIQISRIPTSITTSSTVASVVWAVASAAMAATAVLEAAGPRPTMAIGIVAGVAISARSGADTALVPDFVRARLCFRRSSYYSPLGSYGYGGYGYPVYGGYGYGSGYGVYDYFPTWGASSLGGWGLGSVASTYLSSNYVNPYYSVVAGSQPAATTVVYDYSQPINVTTAPPDPSAADSSEQVFSAARDSFKAGDYQERST